MAGEGLDEGGDSRVAQALVVGATGEGNRLAGLAPGSTETAKPRVNSVKKRAWSAEDCISRCAV
jgi:hypothetical protein